MPNFELNDKRTAGGVEYDEVLVNIPDGKRYAGEPSKVYPQQGQKGNTCLYYGLNYVRQRYGKSYSATAPERKIEIIFSTFRKQCSAIQETKIKQFDFLRGIGNGAIPASFTVAMAQRILRFMPQISAAARENPTLTHVQVPTATSFIQNLLRTFTAQTETDELEDFIQTQYFRAMIAACRETMTALGTDIDAALEKNRLGLDGMPLKNEGSLEAQYTIHMTTMSQLSCEKYALGYSKWTPADSFSNLLEALRTDGTLIVSARHGKSFYNAPARPLGSGDGSKFGSRSIYFWTKGSYKTTSGWTPSHEIIVIGAKRTVQQDKTFEMIFFLDPSDANIPGEERKVYMSSYQSFKERVFSIYGYAAYTDDKEPSGCNGPFAICAQQADEDDHHETPISGGAGAPPC